MSFLTLSSVRSARAGIVAAALALGLSGAALAGCAATPAPAPASSSPAAKDAAASVKVSDAWAKSAAEGMSAVFAQLDNTSGREVTLVAASTDAATSVELHEMATGSDGAMTMREKKGGFPIAAGKRVTLEPGGYHLMLMGLTAPLKAGEEITVTLTFSDESTAKITVPVKDFAGANESYAPEGDGHDMGGEGGH